MGCDEIKQQRDDLLDALKNMKNMKICFQGGGKVMSFEDLVADQVERLEGCVPYFPKNKHLKAELAILFHVMIGPEVQTWGNRTWTQEQRLTWLCDAIVRELPGWPKGGLADVRGIYCDTFMPADGKNIFTTMENCPKPRRLIIDDGQPRIGASPVDAEFEAQLARAVEKIKFR